MNVMSWWPSLPQDDRAIVAGTIIRRLGRAAPGAQDAAGEAFSAATFLTNWNRMSPEARDVIARSGLDDGVAEGLTKLAQVIEAAKEAGTFRNTSNTGNVASSIALGGGLVSAPLTTIATAISTWGAAQLLTYPHLLRAVNHYASSGSPAALRRIAESGRAGALEAATILRIAAPELTSSPRTPATEAARPIPR